MSTLHELFLAQAGRTPGATALIHGSERTTYAELAHRVLSLAGHLRRLGVGPEVPVGVCLERTPDLVASLLAVMAAGGAYVPLDPAYPRERLAFLLEDSGTGLLITRSDLAGRCGAFMGVIVNPSDRSDPSDPSDSALPGQLAYLIYTSGSTGRPKGVALEHRSAVAFVEWAREAWSAEERRAVLASTSIAFDLSVFEIFATLAWGGAVVLADHALELPDLPAAGEVTLINTVPSAMAELVRMGAVPPSVRCVNLAGEPLKNSLAQAIYGSPQVRRVLNLYGPSEDTTYSTWTEVEKGADGEPTIGRPVTGTHAWLVNESLQPVADGEIGEILLGGAGLARGYHRRPELTAERFIPDPFSGVPGSRLYHTGDLGRRRADGSIEYLGRIDHQVKIRGFRIELGEIEVTLEAHPDVREAVVLAREDAAGEKLLAAYVVLRAAGAETSLRAWLLERLPAHMVPSAFQILERLPRTLNGKVDRKALAALEGNALVPQRVLAQAAARPDAVALVAGEEVWTYATLATAALRLAARLHEQGVGPEVRVGLHLERSPEQVIAALAVMLAGGAYLPLDPEVPPERAAFIVEDAGVKVVVGEKDLKDVKDLKDPKDTRPGCVLSFESFRSFTSFAFPPTQTAYIIYTSGSTGRPKGVQVPHAGLLNLVRWHQAAYGLTPADHASVLAAPGFDASVWEIWPALVHGASLCFAPAPARLDPDRLLDWLAAEEVSIGFLPTPLAEAVLARPWPPATALRAMLTGGDRLRRRPTPGLPFVLHNHYGPTECSVVATAGPVAPVGNAEPSFFDPDIGRPIDGIRVVLLDDLLQPVPPGTAGEICLGGAGLARGYVGRPDLTAERFVPDSGGDRLYRTGDLARWREDGRIEFLGRVDFQIKIRGFRIEPGEIEAVLTRQPEVREAVVAARPGASGEPRLVAWIVGADGPPPSAEELRERLACDLPPYMVPAAFVPLDCLPLTPHGKVDRQALPEPEDGDASGDLPRCSQNAVQEILAAIWTDLLGVERVGPQSDFFALGGQSLLATQAASRLRAAFGVELPLQQLFAQPTLAGMARSVEAALALGRTSEAPPIVSVPRDVELPLSFAQERLWFLERFEPGTATYNIAVLYPLAGLLNVGALAHALREVARRHEALRTTFREGASGAPCQVIAPEPRLPLPVVDLGGLPPEARTGEAERLAAEAAVVPFDLETGPLIRALLLRSAPDQHALFLNIHHSVADGWSFHVLERELAAFYAGDPGSLPPLPVQYADFAVWQRRWLQGPVLAEQLAWWRQHLAGAPAGLALPTDRPRPASSDPAGTVVRRDLPEPLAAAVHDLARRAGATPFMVWLAAYASLLARFARQEDLVIGTPVANRNRAETEDLIGFFVNTLALRADLAGRPGFGEVLRRIRAAALGAYTHQDLPLEKLVQELHPDRDPARTPLFRVFLAVRNLVPRPLAPGLGLNLELQVVPTGTAKLDIVLEIVERARGAALFCEHRSSLFDRATIERLLRGFETLLASAVDDPGRTVADLPLLDVAELHQILRVWDEAPRLPRTGSASPAGHEEPQTPLERELAALWAEVLGERILDRIGRIGRNDDFFELGGHSLLAARVFSRVRSRWGVALPVRAAFECPTLAGQAARIAEALGQGEDAARLDGPVPVPRDAGGLPLSFSQQGLWFVQQLEPEGFALNLPCPLVLTGPLDPAVLAAALAGLVRRHEALRTTFAERAGLPVQIVGPPMAPPLSLADLSALPAAVRESEAGRCLAAAPRRPFDLQRGPLLRPLLLRLDREEHRLLLGLHHIVADGWGLQVLLADLGELYAAAAERRPAVLPPLPVQPADVAVWQRRSMSGGRLAGEIAWWHERLAGMEPIRLPLDRPVPAERSRRGAVAERALPAELSAAVRGLAQREGATLFMTLLAAFLGLLHRETGQTDLAVGTPVANRDRPEVEGLVGVFINNLVLRTDLSGDPGFRDLVRRVRDTALAAFAHQETPFEKLVEELEPRRDPARTPLFQVMFLLQPDEDPSRCCAGLRLQPVAVHTGTAQFDLTLFVRDRGADLLVKLEHDLDLFERSTAERLLERLHTLLAAAVADPVRPLSSLLPPPEPRAAEPVHAPAAELPTRRSERVQGTLDDRRSRLSDEQKALLARRLRGRKGEDGASAPPPAARALVPVDPAGTQPPFFCVHPAGGDVLCFTPLARHLGADQPFYGLQSPGIAADCEPLTSLPEMAASYIAEIRQVQPEGPYRLGGWSLGGVVAFEMAQQLARAGQEVELLAIFDTVPRLADTRPDAAEPGFWDDDARWLLDIAVYAEGLWGKSLGLSYEELAALGPDERLARCAGRLRELELLPPGAGPAWLARVLRVFKANVRAGLGYEPAPYPGPITLFRAADAPEGDLDLGWGAWSPLPVEVHLCPGNHVTLLAEANVAVLAERLRGSLLSAREEPVRSV